MDVTYDEENQSQYLSFFLGGEEYALGILTVKEIIRYEPPTRVPRTPDFIRGVINLRGAVVPVIDLSSKFGLERKETTKFTCIVIVELSVKGRPMDMGIIADSVSQVMELSEDEIEPPPDFGTNIAVEFLRGLGRADKRFVLILDAAKLLTGQELAVATQAAATGGETEEGEAAPPAPVG